MGVLLRRAVIAAFAGLLPLSSAHAEQAFSIPRTLGAVVLAHLDEPARRPDYILIQDVHAHGEAQMHIAGLLRLLREHWGVHEAFIEGAFAKVEKHDLPAAYLDEKERTFLTEQGELSGPELALLDNPDTFNLIGIDDPALYRRTLQIYQQLRADHAPLLKEGRSFTKLESALLSLHMTPAEYERWQATAPAIEGSHLRKAAIGMAELFYALTDQRSLIFLNKAAAAPAQGPRVLVTGGYHVQKMCEELTKEGKSFIVVRPTVTRGGFTKVYADHLEQSARLLQIPAVLASANN